MNIKNSSQPWYVEPNLFRRAIAAYPSLQAAIFPPPPTTVTPAQSQDISLYQLLQVSNCILSLFKDLVSLCNKLRMAWPFFFTIGV